MALELSGISSKIIVMHFYYIPLNGSLGSVAAAVVDGGGIGSGSQPAAVAEAGAGAGARAPKPKPLSSKGLAPREAPPVDAGGALGAGDVNASTPKPPPPPKGSAGAGASAEAVDDGI
jgi:hypothetical protein